MARRAIVIALWGVGLLLPVGGVAADVIHLADGRVIHGTVERAGDRATVYTDDGETLDLAAADIDRVEPDPEIAAPTPGERERARLIRRARLLAGRVARADDPADSAEERRELDALPEDVRRESFSRILFTGTPAVRHFAAESLGALGGATAVVPLARAAVRDTEVSVRRAALDGLRAIGHPDTALPLAAALRDPAPYVQLHATEALALFPDRRAVSYLVEAIRLEGGRTGRVHSFFGMYRTYISDWEISSGGTGLTTTEVADPIIAGTAEGTVLDVDVRRIVIVAMISVLERITGENFGPDVDAWSSWYEANRDRYPR